MSIENSYFKITLFVILLICFASLFNGVIPLQYDNFFYMNAARNIFTDGVYVNGFSEIEPQWPILYSLSLVPSYILNIPVQVFARLINIFYFLGGTYFFYLFLRKQNLSKEVTLSAVALVLSNYITMRSVFLEMPDITLYFYLCVFFYLTTVINEKKFMSIIGIGLISFMSVMTKPTGLTFIISCFLGLLLTLMINKKFDKKIALIFIVSLLGTILGKYINSNVTKSLLSNGYELNSFWIKVDGGSSSMKIIFGRIADLFSSTEQIYGKLIFISNLLFPADLFKKINFLPAVSGLLLAIFIVKNIFNKSEITKMSTLSILVYAGMCLSCRQKRHIILLAPWLNYIFVKELYSISLFKNKVVLRKALIGVLLFLNIVPSLVFLGLGNRKNHGGIYQKISGQNYYDSTFAEKKELSLFLKTTKQESIYVEDDMVRFFSFYIGRNVKKYSQLKESGQNEIIVKEKKEDLPTNGEVVFETTNYQVVRR